MSCSVSKLVTNAASDMVSEDWVLWYVRLYLHSHGQGPCVHRVMESLAQLAQQGGGDHASHVQKVLCALPPDQRSLFQRPDMSDARRVMEDCKGLIAEWCGPPMVSKKVCTGFAICCHLAVWMRSVVVNHCTCGVLNLSASSS
jgi:hypothetical protein